MHRVNEDVSGGAKDFRALGIRTLADQAQESDSADPQGFRRTATTRSTNERAVIVECILYKCNRSFAADESFCGTCGTGRGVDSPSKRA